MSGFWDKLPKGDGNEGIISTEKPFDLEFKNLKLDETLSVNLELNNEIDQETILFVVHNGLSSSGNSYILNPRSVKGRVNVVVKNSEDNEILGFILSIPNTLKLNGALIRSGLTTNNCVSLKYRHKNISSSLISTVIDYGFKNEIYTGYHFISQPRTESSIEVLNFFRPLNIKLARECGYMFPEKSNNLRDDKDYKLVNPKYDDLVLLFNNLEIKKHLNLYLSREEFLNQLIDSEVKAITYKTKLIGMCIYKSILLKIAKTGKICPVARLVYFECVPSHSGKAMSKIINHLINDKKHIVMSGVCLGNLTNEELRDNIGICISGKSYLDFYNLSIKKEFCSPENVNLLYV
jgi:hypothetical protein